MRRIFKYYPDLVPLAKENRNNPTPAEAHLWKYLKVKQFYGYDFHRQKPLGRFIYDFFCPRLKMVIEIDGSIHLTEEQILIDDAKDIYAEDLGLIILRFTNEEVIKDIEFVLDSLKKHL